jgi:hypothetical protein
VGRRFNCVLWEFENFYGALGVVWFYLPGILFAKYSDISINISSNVLGLGSTIGGAVMVGLLSSRYSYPFAGNQVWAHRWACF